MKSRQTGNVHLVIIMVLGVVILGLLGFVFWQHFLQPKASPSTTTSAQTTKTASLSATDTVKAISDQIASKYSTSTTRINTNLDSGGGPAYKVSGNDYYVAIAKGASFSITDSANEAHYEALSTPVAADMDTYLTTHGFTKISANSDAGMNDYQTAMVICSIVENISPIGVNCADKSDYVAVAGDVAPFAAAVKLSGPQVTESDTVYGVPVTKDSPTAGYQTAIVSISSHGSLTGGAAGLFYKKGTANWMYFTTSQSVLSCSQYNNAELKAAYAGETCYNSSSESTVR